MVDFPDRIRDVFPRPVIPIISGKDVTKGNPLPVSVIEAAADAQTKSILRTLDAIYEQNEEIKMLLESMAE